MLRGRVFLFARTKAPYLYGVFLLALLKYNNLCFIKANGW